MIRYYIENENGELHEADGIAWVRWFAKANRRISIAYIYDYEISTIFMGIASDFDDKEMPLVYETIIFDSSKNDIYKETYATREEAMEGHQKAIDWLLEYCDKTPE